MKPAPDQNVDDYIRRFPADVQQILRELRKAIRQVVPAAEESISYGIPTYKLAKRPIVYFAGFQRHVSLYPATERSVTLLPGLTPYRSGRGTLKFRLDTPVPLGLVKRFVKLRLKEELARTSRTTAGSRPSRSRTPKAGAAAKRR
jgi:uncharacterized protein YdhG (YjbR/CyaY superfamily)